MQIIVIGPLLMRLDALAEKGSSFRIAADLSGHGEAPFQSQH